MSGHLTPEQLHDHADGLLSDAERAAMESHLATCDACSAESRALRALLAELTALPGIAPGRDLLPAIHARIDAPAPSTSEWTLKRARPWLAAAAVLLVALSSSLTWWLAQSPSGPSGNAPPLATADVQAFVRTDAEYVRAAAELEAMLRLNRDVLPAETEQVLERTLAVIDGALEEARAALARDPANAMLSELLLSNHEKKLDVLRQAAGFTSL